MKCKLCKGIGEIEKTRFIRISIDTCVKTNICPDCLGYGDLDWLEKITGKKRILKDNDVLVGIGEELMHSSSYVLEACVI